MRVKPKYQRVLDAVADGKDAKMKAHGRSMIPLIENGSVLTYRATNDYQIGDVVFCKVKGSYIAAHRITKINSDGKHMIANYRGRENGWASEIFARVIEVDGEAFGRDVS